MKVNFKKNNTKNKSAVDNKNDDVLLVVNKNQLNDANVKIDVVDESSEVKQQIEISTNREQPKKDNKVVNVIMIVLNILSNIAFIFFISDVLRGFNFSGGNIDYNFTVFRVVGLVLFLIAQATGVYLTIKFIAKQKLAIKLVAILAPFTLLLLGGVWVLLSLDNFTSEGEIAFLNLLNLNDFDPASFDFKYVVIAAVVYLIVVYAVFALLFKKARRVNVKIKEVVNGNELDR